MEKKLLLTDFDKEVDEGRHDSAVYNVKNNPS